MASPSLATTISEGLLEAAIPGSVLETYFQPWCPHAGLLPLVLPHWVADVKESIYSSQGISHRWWPSVCSLSIPRQVKLSFSQGLAWPRTHSSSDSSKAGDVAARSSPQKVYSHCISQREGTLADSKLTVGWETCQLWGAMGASSV